MSRRVRERPPSASRDEASPARCDRETGGLRPLERPRRASPVLLIRASSRNARRTRSCALACVRRARVCGRRPSLGFWLAAATPARRRRSILARKALGIGAAPGLFSSVMTASRRPSARAGRPSGAECVWAGRRRRLRPRRPRRARVTPGRATETRSRFGTTETGMSGMRPPPRVRARRRASGPRREPAWAPSAGGRTCSSPPWRRPRP